MVSSIDTAITLATHAIHRQRNDRNTVPGDIKPTALAMKRSDGTRLARYAWTLYARRSLDTPHWRKHPTEHARYR